MLRQECTRLAQQKDLLLTLHQTAQQQLTQAQQMLHDMQHRYDRLLDAPRSAPAPVPPRPQSAQPTSVPRGDMRRRIVALLRAHPQGLTPADIRVRLHVEKRLSSTCLAMLRDGLLRRVAPGVYVINE